MSPPAHLSKADRFRELLSLLSFLRPYRRAFIAAMIAAMVSMSFGMTFPWLLGKMIDAAIPSAKIVESGWRPGLNTLALLLVGTLLIQAPLTFFASYSFNKVGERAVVDLRSRLFDQIVRLPMRFFGERRVGELTSRLFSDLAQIQDMFAVVVPQAIRQVMLFTCGLVAISVTSLKLSLVMLSSLPPVVLAVVWMAGRVRRFSRDAGDRLADASVIVEETLQNIATVKAFANERYESQRYASALDRFLATALPAARLRAQLIAFVIIGIFGSISLVMWCGARLMQRGELSHGELSRFTLFMVLIAGAVASSADVFSSLNKTIGASQRVRQLLSDESPEPVGSRLMPQSRKETPLPAAALRGNGSRAGGLRGEVRFENVEFRYPSRVDAPVLRGVTLHAAAGEKVGLVGPSGAGKSTIVSLLPRFYEPDRGRILLDGRPASEYDLAALRDAIAIVPQEVLLFGGSIRENIAYGRLEAGEDEIRSAAGRANCQEFIERLPEGYDTLVGDRGVKLSGGQRQRVAIARALLRNPAILILDEATSSLDSESEHLIQEALDILLEGRTSFIIAHRLSTIRRVDRIYVIEAGRATESGTHEELMERDDGAYRRLRDLQFAT